MNQHLPVEIMDDDSLSILLTFDAKYGTNQHVLYISTHMGSMCFVSHINGLPIIVSLHVRGTSIAKSSIE